MVVQTFRKTVRKFLLGSRILINEFKLKVRELHTWFAQQRDFSIFGSSLLVAYDNHEPEPRQLRVYMIDFAHTYHREQSCFDDSGYTTSILLSLKFAVRFEINLPGSLTNSSRVGDDACACRYMVGLETLLSILDDLSLETIPISPRCSTYP